MLYQKAMTKRSEEEITYEEDMAMTMCLVQTDCTYRRGTL